MIISNIIKGVQDQKCITLMFSVKACSSASQINLKLDRMRHKLTYRKRIISINAILNNSPPCKYYAFSARSGLYILNLNFKRKIGAESWQIS